MTLTGEQRTLELEHLGSDIRTPLRAALITCSLLIALSGPPFLREEDDFDEEFETDGAPPESELHRPSRPGLAPFRDSKLPANYAATTEKPKARLGFIASHSKITVKRSLSSMRSSAPQKMQTHFREYNSEIDVPSYGRDASSGVRNTSSAGGQLPHDDATATVGPTSPSAGGDIETADPELGLHSPTLPNGDGILDRDAEHAEPAASPRNVGEWVSRSASSVFNLLKYGSPHPNFKRSHRPHPHVSTSESRSLSMSGSSLRFSGSPVLHPGLSSSLPKSRSAAPSLENSKPDDLAPHETTPKERSLPLSSSATESSKGLDAVAAVLHTSEPERSEKSAAESRDPRLDSPTKVEANQAITADPHAASLHPLRPAQAPHPNGGSSKPPEDSTLTSHPDAAVVAPGGT